MTSTTKQKRCKRRLVKLGVIEFHSDSYNPGFRVGELGEYTLHTEPICTRCKQERSVHSIEPPYDTADCPGFSYLKNKA